MAEGSFPAGMLMSIVDVAPADVDDFNNWSDREHLPERVAIPGFLDARRFVSTEAPLRYLSMYLTETFDVLDSPAYRAALAKQTPWSVRNLQRLLAVQRVVGKVTVRHGPIWGRALSLTRLPAPRDPESARQLLHSELGRLSGFDGIVSAFLLEADATLSKPLGASEPPPGADDWYAVVEGLRAAAVESVSERLRFALGGAAKTEIFEIISALPRL